MPAREPPKKNRRTVAGCWTCRARKVKCDGAKPACQRCLKAKLRCRGYGIQLRWSTPWGIHPDGSFQQHDQPETNQRVQRSFIDFVRFPQLMSSDQVDSIADALSEESMGDSEGKRIGPFGVYKLGCSSRNQKFIPEMQTDDKVWIDSDLIPLASTTYMAVCGDILRAPDLSMCELKLKLFPNFYSSAPLNSIESFVHLGESESSSSVEASFTRLCSDLEIVTPASGFLRSLLSATRIQELISSFLSSLRPLSFVHLKTGVLENVFKPILLRVLGEGLIGLQNNQYELTLKECLVLQMVSISANIKSPFGNHLSISIHSRLASLILLSRFFVSRQERGDIQVEYSVLKALEKTKMLKELIVALLLQLTLDEYFDIVSNHRALFLVLEDITSYINENSSSKEYRSDTELQQILKWATVMWEFHRSTSTIDLQKYSVDGEDYADILDHDYNLVDFLDDGNVPRAASKILIKPINSADHPEESDISSEDSTDDIEEPDSGAEQDQPKRFAVQFDFGAAGDGEESEDPGSDFGEAAEVLPNSETRRDIDPSNSYEKQGTFAVELEFGIPDSLFTLLNKCSTLANHRNFFLRKQLHPRNFPKIICDVEEELKAWKLNWQVTTDDGSYISQFHEVMYHSSMCFHDSLVVYFYRLLKDVSPLALQRQITSCVQHLEALTQLEIKETGEYSVEVSRLFWPFFICGCDAVDHALQKRYLRLFGKWKCLKWLGKQIMLEVWRCRSEGDEETSWIDVIKDWKFTGYH